MTYAVDTLILNSPPDRPDRAASPPEDRYWFIQEGELPQLREGRHPAIVSAIGMGIG